MNKLYTLAILGTVLIFATACGIPEEQYNAKVNEALKLKKDLQLAAESNMQLQQQVSQLRLQNQTMASKLQELGQNVQSLLGEKNVLATDLEETKRREAALKAEQEAQRARMAKYRAVIEKFKDLVNSGKLKIKIVNGQMVVQMASNILFETGKADLSDEGKEALLSLASILQTIKDRKFQIAGHTDNVPISSRKFPSNWELSSARAVTVVKFMQENGVNPVNISAAGFAEYQPTASNDDEEGKAANRRIEITLLPNLDELPDLSDLEKDISK
ncbi:MAG: OmpA family protein [Deltaproteobacteria bacterium]|nr:OmpA family protein [Deltaproteobacteria bacterium]